MTKLYEDHAELYDIAFSWDVSDEVDWLSDRLGPDCRAVLEPGCGSGRIVEALARRGFEVVGIDRSPQMVVLAKRRRRASQVEAEIVHADMVDFDLGRSFDGAVSPVNTLAHLTRGELSRHLEQMARHLRDGARYLVQLDLHDRGTAARLRPSRWEITKRGRTLRIAWTTEHIDLASGLMRQRSRIEVRNAHRVVEVVDELHALTVWTPDRWKDAVAASPFAWTAVYDGDRPGRPRVDVGSGRLLWHELTR